MATLPATEAADTEQCTTITRGIEQEQRPGRIESQTGMSGKQRHRRANQKIRKRKWTTREQKQEERF
jgi:hypothetical protein